VLSRVSPYFATPSLSHPRPFFPVPTRFPSPPCVSFPPGATILQYPPPVSFFCRVVFFGVVGGFFTAREFFWAFDFVLTFRLCTFTRRALSTSCMALQGDPESVPVWTWGFSPCQATDARLTTLRFFWCPSILHNIASFARPEMSKSARFVVPPFYSPSCSIPFRCEFALCFVFMFVVTRT